MSACRRRKLVCDLKEQGYSPCRRAKLICHGYRDTEALRVTDESSAVHRKVQSSARSTSNPEPIFRHGEAIPQSLVVSTCSQAKDLFYYNYVVGTLKPFDFLQTFYSPICKDDHLTASMDAVALACLNYQRNAPNAQVEARQQYITALRLMNKAIQDPELANKDSTMLAILLLDLYEKITSKEPHYEGAWAAHLQGALTLVKIRGDKQLDDPTVLRILGRSGRDCALRANIASHIASPAGPKSRESDLMIEFARLRHEIEDRGLPDDEAIYSLQDLDGRFLALSMDVQPTCQDRSSGREIKPSLGIAASRIPM
ncbi:hypothetical protein V1515DRAFT_585245 [Lipomyces mesembrius]